MLLNAALFFPILNKSHCSKLWIPLAFTSVYLQQTQYTPITELYNLSSVQNTDYIFFWIYYLPFIVKWGVWYYTFLSALISKSLFFCLILIIVACFRIQSAFLQSRREMLFGQISPCFTFSHITKKYNFLNSLFGEICTIYSFIFAAKHLPYLCNKWFWQSFYQITKDECI